MSRAPKILFRYRSWTSVLRKDARRAITERNYTKESLENGTFHFSSPHDFDDLHCNRIHGGLVPQPARVVQSFSIFIASL